MVHSYDDDFDATGMSDDINYSEGEDHDDKYYKDNESHHADEDNDESEDDNTPPPADIEDQIKSYDKDDGENDEDGEDNENIDGSSYNLDHPFNDLKEDPDEEKPKIYKVDGSFNQKDLRDSDSSEPGDELMKTQEEVDEEYEEYLRNNDVNSNWFMKRTSINYTDLGLEQYKDFPLEELPKEEWSEFKNIPFEDFYT